MDATYIGLQAEAYDQKQSLKFCQKPMGWSTYSDFSTRSWHHEVHDDPMAEIPTWAYVTHMQGPPEMRMENAGFLDHFNELYASLSEAVPNHHDSYTTYDNLIDGYCLQQNMTLPMLDTGNNSAMTINDDNYETQHWSNEQDILSIGLGSDFAVVENPDGQNCMWPVFYKKDQRDYKAESVLLSSKATDNSGVRVASQISSELDRNEPIEVETSQFQPSLASEESLIDWWLAGTGTQFDSVHADHLSLLPPSPPAKNSVTSTVTRSTSKAGSVRSYVSRITSEPRQGKKRSAPVDDSASSNGSSERSKRTSSSKTSSLCPGCSKYFSRKSSMERHLNTACAAKQFGQQCWVCRPLSRPEGIQECPVCHHAAQDTTCTHRMTECWARTEGGFFTFYRRDLMKRHLKEYHNIRDEDVNLLVDQMKMTVDEYFRLVQDSYAELDNARLNTD